MESGPFRRGRSAPLKAAGSAGIRTAACGHGCLPSWALLLGERRSIYTHTVFQPHVTPFPAPRRCGTRRAKGTEEGARRC